MDTSLTAPRTASSALPARRAPAPPAAGPGPLDVARAIRDTATARGEAVGGDALSRPARAVAMALLLRVHRSTWRWTMSVAQLAADAGYSVRTVFRALDELRARGLVHVKARPPMCSEYHLPPARWLALGREARARATIEREERAAAAVGAPATPGDLPPRWAERLATETLDGAAVVALVVGALKAARCPATTPPATVARAVVRLYHAVEAASPDAFLAHLAVVARAAREATGIRWAEIRGQARRGRDAGLDRSRDLVELCRTGAWGARLEEALAWSARVAAERPAERPAPARAPTGAPALVGPGQPAAALRGQPRRTEDEWLRAELGLRKAVPLSAREAILHHLRPGRRLADGRQVVLAPAAEIAQLAAATFADAVEALAGGAWLLWWGPDDGPPEG